ncbi:hypothetical protein HK44_014615 [Pseudomonas fluorescens HK44]|uniref:Uncharacterized protein n=1 Tax=Pseudomonas fluorescens HK44 TaxID=1042209 RepID=A0A010T3U1_PSEFL|nr:hypothetical protein [Pseudomonas fluorescens]EXF92237.1 hypothetical protein HK44_014615 [Pseudomonas fluorescens HK44]
MNKNQNHLNYIYPLLVLVTSGAGIATIINNLSAGVYPIHQDSIGLPIGAIILVCLTLGTMHLLQLPHRIKMKNGHPAGARLKTLSFISGAISFLLLAGSIDYWYMPDHIIIALFYSFTAMAYFALQIQLLKKHHPA